MQKTVLVTGGAGYIGSHTCKALSQAGFLPITYDNLSMGHAEAVKWGPLIVGDIADREKLKEVISKHKPVGVLHFAADALVIESMNNPAKYYRNNVAGTLCLLETLHETGVNNLIFSSSCATYGDPEFTPMTEAHPQVPTNPYGRTKLIAEQMMTDFEKAHGLHTVKLRYFNAAGADLSGEIGENHTPETHLIPVVIQTALGIRPETVVYGTDFDTRDGSAIRDYIHVQDLAHAHVLALQYLLEHKKSEVFNLGTGIGTSVLEIIDAVKKRSNTNFTVRLEKRRAGEPPILAADNSKILKILGWKPTLQLPEIIDSAFKWHSK